MMEFLDVVVSCEPDMQMNNHCIQIATYSNRFREIQTSDRYTDSEKL